MLKQAVVTCLAFSTTITMALGIAFLLTPTSVQAVTYEYCDTVIYTTSSAGKDKNFREPDVTGRSACTGSGVKCSIKPVTPPTGGPTTTECEVYLSP